MEHRPDTRSGRAQLLDALARRLSPSQLTSLLLDVFRDRASRVRAADLPARLSEQPLRAPSPLDARHLHAFDQLAYEAAAGFEAVDLSPAAPFGASTTLGGIHPNNVLTAIRRVEVLGDNTLALALQCAARRRAATSRRGAPLRLCSSHRVVRLQPVDTPGFSPHFRLFGLVSAGRDRGSQAFEAGELREHLRCYLHLFRSLNARGYRLSDTLVELSHVRVTSVLIDAVPGARGRVREAIRAHRPDRSAPLLDALGLAIPSDVADPRRELEAVGERHGLGRELFDLSLVKEQALDPLAVEHPEARFRFNFARLEGLGYYSGLCLRITTTFHDGTRHPVVDGGMLDWTSRLLQDDKERLLASGIGTEFVCRAGRPTLDPRQE